MYDLGDRVKLVESIIMSDKCVGIIGTVIDAPEYAPLEDVGWVLVRFKDPDLDEEISVWFKYDELKPLNSEVIKTRLGIK